MWQLRNCQVNVSSFGSKIGQRRREIFWSFVENRVMKIAMKHQISLWRNWSLQNKPRLMPRKGEHVLQSFQKHAWLDLCNSSTQLKISKCRVTKSTIPGKNNLRAYTHTAIKSIYKPTSQQLFSRYKTICYTFLGAYTMMLISVIQWSFSDTGDQHENK